LLARDVASSGRAVRHNSFIEERFRQLLKNREPRCNHEKPAALYSEVAKAMHFGIGEWLNYGERKCKPLDLCDIIAIR
jgi:hypothetical protein